MPDPTQAEEPILDDQSDPFGGPAIVEESDPFGGEAIDTTDPFGGDAIEDAPVDDQPAPLVDPNEGVWSKTNRAFGQGYRRAQIIEDVGRDVLFERLSTPPAFGLVDPAWDTSEKRATHVEEYEAEMRKQAMNPVTGDWWLSKGLYGAGNMLGNIAAAWDDTLAGLVGGAAVAGAVTAATAAPTVGVSVLASPLTVAGGAGIGARVGYTEAILSQGVGEVYLELKNRNPDMDDDIAMSMAIGGGTLYAALDKIKYGQLLPSGDKWLGSVKKAVLDKLAGSKAAWEWTALASEAVIPARNAFGKVVQEGSVAARYAPTVGKFAGRTAGEAGIEAAQQALLEGVNVASVASDNFINDNGLQYTPLGTMVTNTMSAFKESITPMAILMAPRHLFDGVKISLDTPQQRADFAQKAMDAQGKPMSEADRDALSLPDGVDEKHDANVKAWYMANKPTDSNVVMTLDDMKRSLQRERERRAAAEKRAQSFPSELGKPKTNVGMPNGEANYETDFGGNNVLHAAFIVGHGLRPKKDGKARTLSAKHKGFLEFLKSATGMSDEEARQYSARVQPYVYNTVYNEFHNGATTKKPIVIPPFPFPAPAVPKKSLPPLPERGQPYTVPGETPPSLPVSPEAAPSTPIEPQQSSIAETLSGPTPTPVAQTPPPLPVQPPVLPEKPTPPPIDANVSESTRSIMEKYPSARVPGGYLRMKLADILTDPDRFQFKKDMRVGTEGETGSTRHITKENWNDLAGTILIWQDPADGKVYVTNGHNRLAAAKRIELGEINVAVSEATNAAEARAEAAMMNIREERGTAIDAATLFREVGFSNENRAMMKASGMNNVKAEMGLALAKLEDGLFNMVASGDLSDERGAIIGAAVEDPRIQREIYESLRSLDARYGKSGAKASIVKGWAERIANSEYTELEKPGMIQLDILGDNNEINIAVIQELELIDAIKEEWRKDAKGYGSLAKQHGGKAAVATGSKIEKEEALSLQMQTKEREFRFEQSIGSHEIMSIVREYAGQMTGDQTNDNRLERDAIERIAEALANPERRATGVSATESAGPYREGDDLPGDGGGQGGLLFGAEGEGSEQGGGAGGVIEAGQEDMFGQQEDALLDSGAPAESPRLSVLRASLAKKTAQLDAKFAEHFADVKSANGQPLNDKQDGRSTTDRWERQSAAIRNLQEGIKKTEAAIEREEIKDVGVEMALEELPAALLAALDAGEITQWRKHPTTFFVPGVDRARIVWTKGKDGLGVRYLSEIPDSDQHRIFARTFNALRGKLAESAAPPPVATEPVAPAPVAQSPEAMKAAIVAEAKGSSIEVLAHGGLDGSKARMSLGFGETSDAAMLAAKIGTGKNPMFPKQTLTPSILVSAMFNENNSKGYTVHDTFAMHFNAMKALDRLADLGFIEKKGENRWGKNGYKFKTEATYSWPAEQTAAPPPVATEPVAPALAESPPSVWQTEGSEGGVQRVTPKSMNDFREQQLREQNERLGVGSVRTDRIGQQHAMRDARDMEDAERFLDGLEIVLRNAHTDFDTTKRQPLAEELEAKGVRGAAIKEAIDKAQLNHVEAAHHAYVAEHPEAASKAMAIMKAKKPAPKPKTPRKRLVKELGKKLKENEGYALDVTALAQQGLGKGAAWAKRQFLKQIKANGLLPESMRREKELYEGNVAAYAAEIAQITSRFYDSVRKVYGATVPDAAEIERWGKALRVDPDNYMGNPIIESLNDEVRNHIKMMRYFIDALSREYKDLVGLSEDLELVFDNNMGVYVQLAYKVWNDKHWAKTITGSKPGTPEYKALMIAKAWILDQEGQEHWQDDRVMNEIHRLLEQYKAADPRKQSPFMPQGKVTGEENQSSLQKRGGVPDALRGLYGEYIDAPVDFTHTAMRIGQMIASRKFLNAIHAIGTQGPNPVFFDPLDDGTSQGYGLGLGDRELPKGNALGPLAGMHTSEDMRTALENHFGAQGSVMDDELSNAAYRLFLQATNVAKLSKTVVSTGTHVNNAIGATLSMASQGYGVDKAKAANALNSVYQTFRETALPYNPKTGKFYTPDEFRQAQSLRYIRLGVTRQSIHANETVASARLASQNRTFTEAYTAAPFEGESKVDFSKRMGKNVFGVAAAVYGGTDDFARIYAFEYERAAMKEAAPEMSDNDLDLYASGLVQDLFMSYSRVGKAVHALRQTGIGATFATFPAEMTRTYINTWRQTVKELRSDRPSIREIGKRRLKGVATVSLLPEAVALGSAMAHGVTPEDDEDVKRFLPEYQYANTMAYASGIAADGSVTVFDVSKLDPWSFMKKPLIAFLRGEDYEESLLNAAYEISRPYAQEGLVFDAAVDIARQRDDETGKDYENPVKDTAFRAYQTFEPTMVGAARNVFNPKRVVEEELASMVGMRYKTLHPSDDYKWVANDFGKEIQEAATEFNKVVYNGQGIADITQPYIGAVVRRQEAMNELRKMTFAARSLGMSEEQMYGHLKEMGVSQAAVGELVTGQYMPWTPSDDIIEKMSPAQIEMLYTILGSNVFQNGILP